MISSVIKTFATNWWAKDSIDVVATCVWAERFKPFSGIAVVPEYYIKASEKHFFFERDTVSLSDVTERRTADLRRSDSGKDSRTP